MTHDGSRLKMGLSFLKKHKLRVVMFAFIFVLSVGIFAFVSAGRNQDTRAAQDAGHKAAANILDSYIEGMGENVDKLSKLGLLNSKSAEAMLNDQIDKGVALKKEFDDALAGSGDDQRAFMEKHRLSLFGNLDADAYSSALRNVTDTLSTMGQDLEDQTQARLAVMEVYTNRSADLEQRFGMSSEEIYNLANETGTNLMDATMDYVVMVERLGFNSSSLDSISESFNLSKASETSDLLKIFKILVEGLSKYLD